MTDLEEFDLKMNLSEYHQRKLAIWEMAANPDLSNGFFTFAGCYLVDHPKKMKVVRSKIPLDHFNTLVKDP